MSYYIGTGPSDVIDGFAKRYFYGLRRNDDGELFLVRSDQLKFGDENVITVNDLGEPEENFNDFEEGIDFLAGLDPKHQIEYANLRYPQYRWDGRYLTYYIDHTTGQFIQRLSEDYTYPEGLSGPGY